MKLKYNLIALSLLGAFATACDPMEDIYNEIDADGTTNTQTMSEYVLTALDYETISSAAAKDAATDEEKALASAVKSDKALNDFATAEKYIPTILANMLPSWGKNSSVGVTYNYQNAPSEFVQECRKATTASLGSKDYEAIWGEGSPVKFLSPVHAPATVLPAWLAENYKDAAESDFILVDYKYDETDPVFTGSELFSQNFETVEADKDIALDGWAQVALKGSRNWQGKTYGGNGYAQFSANGFNDGAVDTWLISPAVDITTKDASLSFDIKFGYYNADCFDVLVSDTYTGNGTIDATQWTSLKSEFTYPEGLPGGYNTDFVNVGKSSLAAYNGKKIYIALRYVGEGPKAKTTTVQIDNLSISSAVLAPTNEQPCNALYQFDGENWKAYTNSKLVVVAPADYDAMGSPGSHDNFSASDAPENYLPQFLAQKFPYAQEGDVKAVMYKYYDKTTFIEVNEYLFSAGQWILNDNIELKEKVNFVFADSWMFDPTVTKSLASNDYLILENWVKANKDAGYMDPKYGNSEYWFGGSSYYVNFNVQLSKRRSNDPDNVVPADDTEAEAYLLLMVQQGVELILATEYASAPAQVSGIDCYYIISAKVYNGLETFSYTYKFKGLGNAKFELEGEPEVSK